MQQGVNILVVDDDADVRQCIKLLLEHDGHEVTPADSGEAALAQLAQRKFDLVITDFSMPGMQGDQLVARIRQLMPNQPIIMTTGFVEEYKVFGQESGRVDALLLKPFSHEDLHEAVEKALFAEHPEQTSGMPTIIKPSSTPNFIPPPET